MKLQDYATPNGKRPEYVRISNLWFRVGVILTLVVVAIFLWIGIPNRLAGSEESIPSQWVVIIAGLVGIPAVIASVITSWGYASNNPRPVTVWGLTVVIVAVIGVSGFVTR